MIERATQFAARNWSIPIQHLELSIETVLGGLESRVVRAAFRAPAAKLRQPTSFVVKELRGLHRRETNIYRELAKVLHLPTVRLLGIEKTADADYLYLEDATQQCAWPWRKTAASAAVCRALARLHDSEQFRITRSSKWDYERELAKSAGETLAMAIETYDEAGVRRWRRVGDLRRVVTALPRLRATLLKARTFIHGDVHSGNVIVRAAERGEIAFIDWARARLGSPLEDVASWLHSLGCWEPEARRRHDTLLRAYLEARTPKQTITAELRQHYWYASASNGLSGAIRYHLVVLHDPAATAEMKSSSAQLLREWERVMRHVAEILTTTERR